MALGVAFPRDGPSASAHGFFRVNLLCQPKGFIAAGIGNPCSANDYHAHAYWFEIRKVNLAKGAVRLKPSSRVFYAPNSRWNGRAIDANELHVEQRTARRLPQR